MLNPQNLQFLTPAALQPSPLAWIGLAGSEQLVSYQHGSYGPPHVGIGVAPQTFEPTHQTELASSSTIAEPLTTSNVVIPSL